MNKKKIVVVHGCGVENPGTYEECLTVEGKMRILGALQELEKATPPDSNNIEEVNFYLTGGKAQAQSGQEKSEATHMKNYLEELQKKFFPSSKLIIIEEGESTDTYENIVKVVEKTKEDLFLTLQGFTKENLVVYTSNYHTHRVGLVWRNILSSKGMSDSLLRVFASDEVNFSREEIKKEYQKVTDQYKSERANRSFSQKAKGRITEAVGSLFAYFNLDKFLSTIHEKAFPRKLK